MNICFLGMSHLGIVSSIAAASKGINVFCFDEDKDKIKNLKNEKFEVDEPDLIKTFNQFKSNITFFSEFKNIDLIIDVYIISQDIKTSENGISDLTQVKKLLKIVKKLSLPSSAVVILSQVPPKFTRAYRNKFTHLYYQVETLIFGNAVKRAIYPERIIVGVDQKEKKITHKKFNQYLKLFGCQIVIMNYESAELAKLSINLFLISSITFGNLMNNMSSRIGADWSDILFALKLDRRIGLFSYIQPGLGLSGGNLERDLKNITSFTNENRIEENYFELLAKINKDKKRFPIKRYEIFKKTFGLPSKVSILGVVYKDNTNSYKNSPTLELLKYLKKDNNFYVYDKHIDKIEGLSANLLTNSLKNSLQNSDVVFIMSPLKEFSKLNTTYLKYLLKSKLIIDPFRVITEEKILKKRNYFYN